MLYEVITNHFNCPVVAYYPEVLRHNISELQDPSITFISDYLSLGDRSFLPKRMHQILSSYFDVTKQEIRWAVRSAYDALEAYQKSVRTQGQAIIENARNNFV